MSRRIDCCSILFADIAGSTQIYEILGDRRAQRMVAACLSKLSEVVQHHRGEVIKTIGDEVMCTFAKVDDAIQAAAAMNHNIDQWSMLREMKRNYAAPESSAWAGWRPRDRRGQFTLK
jgi:class 3 adenylate cyclase